MVIFVLLGFCIELGDSLGLVGVVPLVGVALPFALPAVELVSSTNGVALADVGLPFAPPAMELVSSINGLDTADSGYWYCFSSAASPHSLRSLLNQIRLL